MTIGKFCWTDLSTFEMDTAREDYRVVFGWKFSNDPSYDFAQNGGASVAAVFPMPEKLAAMKLPSFWMSYIHVESLDDTLAKARKHDGVIVEIEPQPFDEKSRIALVRDPSGAGFTLYEGPDITPKSKHAGNVLTRFHHVPELELIRSFYTDLFGWQFRETPGRPWQVFDIVHPDGEVIGQVECVPPEVRGKFKYWMPSFAVRDLDETLRATETRGGGLLYDLGDGRLILEDQQGAGFMIQADNGLSTLSNKKSATSVPVHALIGISFMWAAVVLDVSAFWGALFLLWTWPALKSGHAHMIEPVARKDTPITYWLLVGTWLVLSIWMIADGWPHLIRLFAGG